METPVTGWVSILNKDTKKALFQSTFDSVQEDELPGFSTPLASLHSRLNRQKRNRKLTWSPVKRIPIRSPPKKKSREGPWTDNEMRSLIEFVALYKDLQTSESEWPSMRPDHVYWSKTAEYVKLVVGSSRSSISCRSQIVNHLRKTFTTIAAAEDAYKVNYEVIGEVNNDFGYLENISTQPECIDKILLQPMSRLSAEHLIALVYQVLKQKSEQERKCVLKSLLVESDFPDLFDNTNLSLKLREQLIAKLMKDITDIDQVTMLDSTFKTVCLENGIEHPPEKFLTLSVRSMKTLQENGKPNVLLDFAKCLGTNKPDSNEPLLPINKMPFGLIQHQLQFFSATNVNQITIPEDYYQWLETLDTEFEDRLGRLIRGPMWSGLPKSDVGDPLKARVNLAAVSQRTIQRRTAISEFTTSPTIQLPAVKSFGNNNPSSRVWLKLDGTDVKESLQHSVRGEWNGDVNLNNGHLERLREDFDKKLAWIELIISSIEFQNILEIGISCLEADTEFLRNSFTNATNQLQKKITIKTTNSETLKGLNWDVVECNTLLQQSLEFSSKLKSVVNPKDYVKSVKAEYATYLKNLFKKKRTAATHILVIAIADEQRNRKPYALPVQYLPYKSLRDKDVRSLTEPIKASLTEAGLHVIGLVTDGEFNSLRTQGDTGPLHTWQLVHDAKEAVRKMSKASLEAMLTYAGEDDNGTPYAEIPNEYVPSSILMDIVELLNEGLTFEDGVIFLRGSLVPEGYTSFPFRKDTPESYIDHLRSLMCTYIYRNTVNKLKRQGRDFSRHLYVPEVDKITGKEFHERGDHNHILKRIAASTRECRFQNLDPEAFDKTMMDPRAGLSHAALTGQRPQSVEDAEKLLSYHVAASMQRNGYDMEADYISTIAAWHEASDGRGIPQLQRCKANHKLLNYILDDFMPWYKDYYDFTYIDVNRPMENIRGFTRETFIELTSNIESQEIRRIRNTDIGYAEHPRAGTTDDVECFFSLTRRQLGDTFTVHEFKNRWPTIVREYCKRMDPELPFHYWTRNERFKIEETNFDKDVGAERLHTVRHAQREDCSIFTSGRAFLPARNKQSIRQRLFRVDVGLPPVPENLQPGRA